MILYKQGNNTIKSKLGASCLNLIIAIKHMILKVTIFIISGLRLIHTSKKVTLKRMKLSHMRWIRKAGRHTREARLRQIAARRIEHAFMHDATEINLADCILTQLPKSFYKLHNLQVINLSGNRLTHLANNFRNLENITHLDLSRNKFIRMPALHLNIHHPFTLNISHNMITSIPQASFSLLHATHINLSCNRIKRFPNKLEYFSNLKQLDISYNPIEMLPECFAQLEELKELAIAGIQQEKLKNFPPQAVIL